MAAEPLPSIGPPRTAVGAIVPGVGRIEVVRSGPRSVVTRAYGTSPLRLLTPANHGHAAWIYTSSYGGGLVDGDIVDIDIRVGPGAAAFVSTQSSTKVYRSPRGTRAELRGRVEAEGLAIVAPDPVVCFAGARYRQLQRFHLADSAGLIVVDCLAAGRCAAGERWAFAEYRSLLEVSVGNRLLVHDGVALRASDGDLARRLGRFDGLAVVVIAGRPLRAEAARLLAASADQPVAQRADQLMRASPLGDDGCIVRVAGTSVARIWRTLRDLLRFVPDRLGDDPWARKW